MPTDSTGQSVRRLRVCMRGLAPAPARTAHSTTSMPSSPVLAAAAPRPLKIAFVGFRHGHIGSVYQAARASAALEVT